jgi:hypothetical protein
MQAQFSVLLTLFGTKELGVPSNDLMFYEGSWVGGGCVCRDLP